MNWITQLSAHLLGWTLLAGLVTLLVLAGLAVALWRHREHAAAPDEENAAQPQAPGAALLPAPLDSGLPVTSLGAADLTLSFLRAIKYLRSQTSGRRRLYQVPWFLLLGEAGAGKTSLLRSLAGAAADPLDGPAGDTFDSPRNGLGWSFFDHGVVLDVPGDYLLQPSTLQAHERGWRGLLRLLNRSRGRRPLDGVVLVLPAQDFLPTSELTSAELGRKAQALADKLAQLQRESAVCFPVYILVSQCDRVEGFSNFCAALPPARLREMFGWSSPHRADASFDPAWVDEAFHEIALALNRTQSEIFVENPTAADPASLFFFPGEMLELRERLRAFLQQLFRGTAYRDTFHCRGLYFTGEGPEPADADTAPAAPPSTSLLALPLARHSRRPVFLEELFERKIFPEWGLAYPERSAASFRRGALLTTRSVTLAVASVLVLGMAWGYYHLDRLRRQVLPVLQSIQTEMQPASNVDMEQQAHALVRSVADLGNDRFVSLFFPASWSRGLDQRMEASIESAFQNHVLLSIRQELLQRADSVTTAVANNNGDADPDPADADNAVAAPALPLDQLPQYAALQQFTTQIEALEDNLARYQRIIQPGSVNSVEDLDGLMHYLEPAGTYSIEASDQSYLGEALSAATGQPFSASELAEPRARVNAEMKAQVDALYTAWFDRNPDLSRLQDLADRIDSLANAPDFGYTQLQALQTELEQAEAWANGPQSSAMADPNALFLGPLRQVTLDPVERSAGRDTGLFYPAADLEIYIRNGATTGWQQLHNQLAGVNSSLTGPLLQLDPTSMRLSDGIESLRLPIVNLMGLSFMSNSAAGAFRDAIPADITLTWDPGPLSDALGMVGDYQRYMEEGLQQAPAGVRDAFRTIALAHLQANLDAELAQAQVWAPASDTATTTSAAVENFQTASPQLTGLLVDLAHLGDDSGHLRLLDLLNQQAFSMLGALDRQLAAAAPYQPHLADWTGQLPPALAAFDLHTPDELGAYLAYQRQQLEALAASAAPLTDFLRQSPAPNRTPAQSLLLSTWQDLITQVQAYQNKQPGNGLTELEDFISTGMDQTTPASHCQPAPAAPATLNPGYFQQLQARLATATYARCRQLDASAAQSGYTAVARQFNQTLAGKFPFAPPGSALDNADEAEPAAIVAFYQTLDQAQPHFGAQLSPAEAAFIQQIDALRPLFAALLSHASPVPVYDVTPTFRVNQSRERDGNQIMTWTLKFGAQNIPSGQSGRWVLGQPVTLSLVWASDSPLVPLGSRNRTVTFTYTDPWSLFTLLARQRAPASDFDLLQDTTPTTLAFTIPTGPASPVPASSSAPNSSVLVFIRLAIQSPGTVESLRIPIFPPSAPLEEAATDAGDRTQ